LWFSSGSLSLGGFLAGISPSLQCYTGLSLVDLLNLRSRAARAPLLLPVSSPRPSTPFSILSSLPHFTFGYWPTLVVFTRFSAPFGIFCFLSLLFVALTLFEISPRLANAGPSLQRASLATMMVLISLFSVSHFSCVCTISPKLTPFGSPFHDTRDSTKRPLSSGLDSNPSAVRS
jgi:hypothetical protein